jgi:predicted ATPase/class 3 adenylate cyclase
MFTLSRSREIVARMEDVRQPSGNVSMLFTDIEGSTALLQSLGADRFGSLLARQRELLRAAFAARRGFEVNCEGDSFFVAFGSASEAATAAAEAQRALAAEPWPDDIEVRVRMGIHTGEPLVAPPKYVGVDVHQAARIMQAGHGGQVLVSQATHDLLDERFRLRDLGVHRLKDLVGPQRIYQLDLDGLPCRFPALRTLENRATNLPTQTTALIGRARELAEVQELLGRGDVRLLTLTGAGGTGKTRLALQAAANVIDAYADGVFFVELAPIGDPAMLVPAVAQALSLREQRGLPLAATLHGYLRERTMLLVLDNLEHVSAAGSHVARLLRAAPQLTVIATSRAPLRVSGEHLYPVPPLGVPDLRVRPSLDELRRIDAVDLFVTRARAVRPEFELDAANAAAVAELCARLDGLPLAIELAAARSRLLSPQALLKRLDLRLLSAGPQDVDRRQQTLRATIEWSYDLLAPAEQTLFTRLAVFHGGCSLDAAEAVGGTPDPLAGLEALVESSVLRQEEEPDGEPRFTMLETIRAYALERLEQSGESAESRRRHAEWFATIDERMTIDWRVGEVDWPRVERELDNFRAALDELAERDPASFVDLVWKLRHFCLSRGHLREGLAWAEQATRLAAELPDWLKARAWQCEGSLALFNLELDRAEACYRQALDARSGDRPDDAVERAWSVRALSLIAGLRGENDEADALSQQAMEMFRELGDVRAQLLIAPDRALAAMLRGDYARARGLLDESVAQARGQSPDHLANTLVAVGILELLECRHAEAEAAFVEVLEYSLRHGRRTHVGLSLRGLAAGAAAQGRLEPAARMLGAADRIDEETGGLAGTYDFAGLGGFLAPIREAAVKPETGALLAAGRAMTDSEAATYALERVTSAGAVSGAAATGG